VAWLKETITLTKRRLTNKAPVTIGSGGTASLEARSRWMQPHEGGRQKQPVDSFGNPVYMYNREECRRQGTILSIPSRTSSSSISPPMSPTIACAPPFPPGYLQVQQPTVASPLRASPPNVLAAIRSPPAPAVRPSRTVSESIV
jgi:hypothetical protein